MTTTTTRRPRRFALALAGLAGLAGPGTAAAGKPITSPPTPIADEFVVPAGEACDFDLVVTATGKVGAIEFESGRGIYTAPGLRMTFTRAGTTSVVQSIATGSFHDEPGVMMGDGSYQLRTHATGHNVLFGPFTEDGQTVNSARLYIGSVNLTLTFAPDGIVGFSEIDASAARVIDLCAELS